MSGVNRPIHVGRPRTGKDSTSQDRAQAISRLTEEARHRILVEWNETARDYPRERSLHEFIEDQVDRTPNAPALVFGCTQLSYQELNVRANRLAHYLRRLGVGPEVLVGVYAGRSVEMIVALLGVMKAGGAYLPLDPECPRERLAALLEDSRPLVVIVQDELRGALPEHGSSTVFLNGDSPLFQGERESNPPVITHGQNLAYAMYTSGSTGMPKCVLNVHEAIVNRLLWMQDTYRLDSRDRVLQKTPYTFDVSVWEFFWPLMAGACLVVARPGGHKDPNYLVDEIIRQGITVIHFVPSMFHVFLEAPGIEGCAGLRHIFCSGEALPVALRERFFRRLKGQLHNLYGPTEAAVDVTAWTCDPTGPSSIVPIGKPIWNTRIYILDSNLEPAPPGAAGELHIGGVALARGYLNRPELTAQKLIPDPFSKEPGARLFKTGDEARFLPDGNIEYLGRIDHQVKIHGIRIEPGEIESVLTGHPSIRQAVVIADEERPGQKRLVAYLVARRKPVSLSELRESLRAKLPESMIPAAFVVLDALPLTVSGKLDRKSLPRPCSNEGMASRVPASPRNSLERTLCRIWEEVLNVRSVDIDDGFSDLGGDSLAAACLFVRIHQIYGKNLQAVNLMNVTTVRAMAEVIRSENSGSAAKSLVTLRGEGSLPPLFLVSGILGHVVNFFSLAVHLGPEQPTYALQPPGIDLSVPYLTRVEDIAAHYIREIKFRQPSAPYYLAGYSFGGMIVFEMARQLLARGDRVAIAALLDAPEWRYERRMKRIMRFNRVLFGPRRLTYLTEAVQSRWPGGIHKMHDRLRHRAPQNRFTLEEASRLAANRYVPRIYPGRLTLLRTSPDGALVPGDPFLGWGQLATGGVEVHEIPGGHFTITDEPYVAILAHKLRECLDRARPAGLPSIARVAGAGG